MTHAPTDVHSQSSKRLHALQANPSQRRIPPQLATHTCAHTKRLKTDDTHPQPHFAMMGPGEHENGNTATTMQHIPRDAFHGSSYGRGGKGSRDDISPALKSMEASFARDQLVHLAVLPPGATEAGVIAFAAQCGVAATSAAISVTPEGESSCRIMLSQPGVLQQCVSALNAQRWQGVPLQASVPPPDAMLFVGNLGKQPCMARSLWAPPAALFFPPFLSTLLSPPPPYTHPPRCIIFSRSHTRCSIPV